MVKNSRDIVIILITLPPVFMAGVLFCWHKYRCEMFRDLQEGINRGALWNGRDVKS